MVSETIHNLRAALDYLIYELAILDSGQIQQGTQFPIEDTPKGWKRHRGFLKGLSCTHKAAVERLQPYNGCNWIALLRSLSNPDKHRTFTVIGGTEFTIIRREQQADSPTTRETVDVDSQTTYEVLFIDGLPVVETLEVLHSEITSVLDQFKAEF